MHTPSCHVILAVPTDAPALVVGGLIVVNLSYANLSYLATMNIRSDFNDEKTVQTLFDEFKKLIEQQQTIAFCDILRRSQLRVRMPFFLTRKTYSIFKIVGYAENIVFACSHYISHLEKRSTVLPTLFDITDEHDISTIFDFDSLITGEDRSNALKNISQLNGFNGALAVSKDRETMGYAISVPALRSDHIKIGPLYAINRRIALLLLRQLCKAVKPESLISLNISSLNDSLYEFLHNRAICEIERTFDRYHNKILQTDDHRRIFAISAFLTMPDY
ncbi:unnamed protein product [Dracunculus medinensis]|uniref:Acetyltransf_18 domain-containing protein n=1 Tax=Dracunculus medinensis TaxID=318479 RepID=A0A0N4UF89_DRAME|nr:unnamed protein product [Dracunculus medinensis]